jgi:lipoprotein NlpI
LHFSLRPIGWAAALAVIGAALLSPAIADDADTCVHGKGDEKVAACTKAIKSGRWRGRDLAWAYVNRGWAYDEKTDYDRAIADETEAIRLDPKNASAYLYRGWAYDDKDEYDRAIADETEAIRLDPKRAAVYNNRGSAYVDKLDYARAIADFTEAIRLDPKYSSPYRNLSRAHLYTGKLADALADMRQANALDPKNRKGALWLDIIGERNNVPSRLADALPQLDMTTWPAPLIRMFLGQLTPAAALAAAESADPETKKSQVCEANFFGGEMAMRTEAKDEAIRLFRAAASDCPHGDVEWDAAKAELKASASR